MNILIVGFGYAGKRFYSAFKSIASKEAINFACVTRGKVDDELSLPCYPVLKDALTVFKPSVVIISTTDNEHVKVMADLAGYTGFVICEKPLAVPGDNWKVTCKNIKGVSGFALNLVERYSFATVLLKSLIKERGWSLVRGSFFWGKNRINDYRPTCGVMSEVIHPLDLMTWICDDRTSMVIKSISGIRSDFSISGAQVLDTVLLTAEINGVPISGYSSFVNIQRQRNMDFSFTDPEGEIIHARITYDTPAWDCDHIRVWAVGCDGNERVLVEQRQENDDPKLSTILKLSALCRDVYYFVSEGRLPSQPFPDLKTASQLQDILDDIQKFAVTPSSACYIRHGERVLLPKEAALEVLG